jgi:hypothetical protein
MYVFLIISDGQLLLTNSENVFHFDLKFARFKFYRNIFKI